MAGYPSMLSVKKIDAEEVVGPDTDLRTHSRRADIFGERSRPPPGQQQNHDGYRRQSPEDGESSCFISFNS